MNAQNSRSEISSVPEWISDNRINEVLFCKAFLESHPMLCINGTFFTVNGRVTDEKRLLREILEWIEPHITTGLAKRVSGLLEILRMKCYAPPLPVHTDRIHVANGTYFLSGSFSETKEYCANRLPVAYCPDAATPTRWLHFLDQLLYPEDIPTLQEYMGYCLIPTTKAQKMLFLIGKGGEGKSRVGLVMRALLGENMNTGSIQKVETSPFARADLEHLLVMVDDDMKLEALPQTNHIKTIVTAEQPMDLERKGQQSYQGNLSARFLVFGNGTMKSLYDRSEGFFRRQLILSVRDRDRSREDDPFLAEKLCAEAEGIFLWALEGLNRLIARNYHFTISKRAEENMDCAIKEGNNIVEFMESDGYFVFRADSQITAKDFYAVYELWCSDYTAKPVTPKSFGNYLSQHLDDYHLEHDNKVHNDQGRRVWGYWGIEAIVHSYV